MGFFNSLSIRLPLAAIGGILYGFITYFIIAFFSLSSELAIFAWIFVFLFYLGSRLLILFSGIDSPYYAKGEKAIPKRLIEKNSFYQTTQWVGKFYHYHDMVLFGFLAILSILFLITLIIDALEKEPIGSTIRNLLNALIPFS